MNAEREAVIRKIKQYRLRLLVGCTCRYKGLDLCCREMTYEESAIGDQLYVTEQDASLETYLRLLGKWVVA